MVHASTVRVTVKGIVLAVIEDRLQQLEVADRLLGHEEKNAQVLVGDGLCCVLVGHFFHDVVPDILAQQLLLFLLHEFLLLDLVLNFFLLFDVLSGWPSFGLLGIGGGIGSTGPLTPSGALSPALELPTALRRLRDILGSGRCISDFPTTASCSPLWLLPRRSRA